MDNMLRCSNLICGAWREVSITSTGSVFRKMSLKCQHFPNLTVGRGGMFPWITWGLDRSIHLGSTRRRFHDWWLKQEIHWFSVCNKTLITGGGWLLDDCEKWLAEQPSREFLLFDWKYNDSVVDSQISTRVQKPDLSWKKWWRGWTESSQKTEASSWSQLTPRKWVVAEQRIPSITTRYIFQKKAQQKNINFCVHIFAKSQPKHLKLYNIEASKTEDEKKLFPTKVPMFPSCITWRIPRNSMKTQILCRSKKCFRSLPRHLWHPEALCEDGAKFMVDIMMKWSVLSRYNSLCWG